MYVVIRRWTGGAIGLAERISEQTDEARDILRSVPGFVAYYAIRDGDTVATVTVAQDREGAKESTRRAREWVRQNFSDADVLASEITEGDVISQF